MNNLGGQQNLRLLLSSTLLCVCVYNVIVNAFMFTHYAVIMASSVYNKPRTRHPVIALLPNYPYNYPRQRDRYGRRRK